MNHSPTAHPEPPHGAPVTRPACARRQRIRAIATLTLCGLAIPMIRSLPLRRPEWDALVSWRRDTSAELVDATLLTLRLGVLLALCYLTLACTLQLVLSVAPPLRRRGLARFADVVTPRWLALAGIGLVGTSTVWSPAAASAASHDPLRRDDVRLEVVDDVARPTGDTSAQGGSTTDTTPPGSTPPRTMLPWAHLLAPPDDRAVPPPAPPTTLPDAPRLERAGGASSAAPEDGDDPTDVAPTQGPTEIDPGQLPPPLVIERGSPTGGHFGRHHVVAAGEHFWGIAEQVVAERRLAVPVASYWVLLVEANRDRLVHPADPDLLHPGQELVLP